MGLQLLDELKWPAAIEQLKNDSVAKEYANAAIEFMDEARKLASVNVDQQAIDNEPILKIAYDWMRDTFPAATDFSKARVDMTAFQADKTSDLPGLIERLQLGVPPNELGNPLKPVTVDYRSALFAAWLYKLRGLNPASPEPLSEQETDRLNQNTLRAVEYILLQNDYRKAMSQEATT